MHQAAQRRSDALKKAQLPVFFPFVSKKRFRYCRKMHFEPNQIYHVYNRGNNKHRIFYNDKNYLYLLSKVQSEWLKYCELVSYCLMPNHFHFMLLSNADGCEPVILNKRATAIQNLSKVIGKSLSSYTQAINIQNKTTGNLFQKKTKAKCLTDLSVDITDFPVTDYLINCFHYIHLNPLEANLVKDLSNWSYSSWPCYAGLQKDDLCCKEKWMKLLGLSTLDLMTPNNFSFNKTILDRLW